MKKYIILTSILACLAAGCAKSPASLSTDATRRYLEAWVHVQKQKHPEYLWKQTPLGAWILEDKEGSGKALGEFGDKVSADEKANIESKCASLKSAIEANNTDEIKRLKEELQKAAEDDIAYAQCKLGDMYMMGRGVPKDLVKAATLYLQAESLRHLTPESAKNLAQCYTKKISSIHDVDQAEKRIKQLQGIKDNDRLITLLNKLSK